MTLIDDSRMKRPLPHPIKQVLKTMFVAYSKLIVKSEFSEGLSGSCVYLVRPFRKNGRPELPSVVKVDDSDRIAKEWQAYKSCIQNQLPSVAKISDKLIYQDGSQLGGLRYPLAGDGAFDVMSLQEYCQQASVDDIGSVLKERLFKSLEELWNHKKVQYELYLHTAYDSFLHPNLLIEHTTIPIGATQRKLEPDTVQEQSQPYQVDDLVQISGFQVVRVLRKSQAVVLDMPAHLPGAYRLQVQSVSDIVAYKVGQTMPYSLTGQVKQTREGVLQELAKEIVGSEVDLTDVSIPLPNNVTLPNPLVALPKLLNQSFDAYTACIHADLHLGNVLVEPKSGNVHLIDFVNAREDHILRDFLNLELAIVNWLVPAALDKAGFSPKRIIPFYERLHCALLHPRQLSPPPGLERPFALLLIIREAAKRYLFKRDEWREYYHGLIFYLLGSLRYDNLKKVPGAKQTAFWGAATALKLLQTEASGAELASCTEFLSDHDAKTQPPSDPQKGRGEKEDRTVTTHIDNRRGGVYIEGENAKIEGNIVGGNQTKTIFYSPVSGPIHTGRGDINIGSSDTNSGLVVNLKKLSSSNLEKRIKAAKWLGQTRQEAAIPILSERLREERDQEAFYWIANALGEIGGKHAEQALLEFQKRFHDRMDKIHHRFIYEALTLIQGTSTGGNK